MNEMLRSLGFGQVSDIKWTNGKIMMILILDYHIYCTGDINDDISIEYAIEKSDPETMKHHIEKFMRMVGKCIQVDEE